MGSTGYRSVLRLDDETDAVRTANEQFRSWLKDLQRRRKQGLDTIDWEGPGAFAIGPGATLNVAHHEGEDGGRRQLLELVDANRDGTWTTRVFAASRPSARRLRQTLWVETHGVRPDGTEVSPDPPKLVRQILEAVDARDGEVPVLAKPQVMSLDDVEALVQYVLDEHRDISIVVAAPIADVPPHRWAAAVANLVRDSAGCASAFVLTADALDAFNAALGAGHAVPASSVRTYLPNVDVDDSTDARRHRVLGARTMSAALGGNLKFRRSLVAAHSRAARQHILDTGLPADLLRVERILQRELLGQARQITPVTDELVESPRLIERVVAALPSVEPAWIDRLRELVRRVLGLDVVDEDAIEGLGREIDLREERLVVADRQVTNLLDDRDVLNDQLAELRKRLEAEELEREIAEESRRGAEKQTRSLLRWKAEQGLRVPVVSQPDSPWEEPPSSVLDLVSRFADDPDFAEVTRYVELTDLDRAFDRAVQIDERDKVGKYATAFWEYLLILRDYVIATENGFSGGVHAYLKDPNVEGRKCSEHRHKPGESRTVKTDGRMRSARMFPVPTAVAPEGKIFMEAHFAPTHRDTTAPRMYYVSDVSRTGKVYVGYIGSHPKNTKTN